MSNQLANVSPMKAIYKADSGQEITLDAQIVRDVCASGNAKVSDRECRLFIELCKAHRLNPFIKEAYLVKYGDSPATIITGKDVFTKRASSNPNCEGYRAGVYVVTANGQYKEREGSMVIPGERLIGGWAEVYMKGYKVPIKESVGFHEYNTGKSGWKKMPGTMIRKVALVHALREAMPEDFTGLYDQAEMDKANQEAYEEVEYPQSDSKPISNQAPIDVGLGEAQAKVGSLMRLMKAEGWDMNDIHAYAQKTYVTEIKDMSKDQLNDFAKDLDRMYQEAQQTYDEIELVEVEQMPLEQEINADEIVF